jgi:ribonuclease R
MERAADGAARASQRIKMAELYADYVGEVFSGVVCGCERFGLFVMLDETCAEGLLPARTLGGEWLEYDEDRMTLTGEESGRVWGLGTRVRVVVTETDVPRGRIDFALADPRDAAR